MASEEFLWTWTLFVLVLFGAQEAFGSETCLTPSGYPGRCINIRQCEPLVNMLTKQQPLSLRSVQFLQSSKCGFEGNDPKVCCESQTTTPKPTSHYSPSTPSTPDVTSHPNLRLLNDDFCGPFTDPKISGGNKTTVFEFPWMALLFYVERNRAPEVGCGGSLINNHYVLTAAHCVKFLPAGFQLARVRLGEHDLSTETDCDQDQGETICAERYQDFAVQSVHPHPKFSRRTKQNDLALIRIKGEADFRPDNVRPICLPIGAIAPLTKKTATVTGWGATEKGPTSQDLLKVTLPIVQNEQCGESYRDYGVQIWYKHMCAGGVTLLDSCSGDSGGPLQVPSLVNGQPRYVQYGVVSYGLEKCGLGGLPGIYTRVSYYIDWILDTITD